MKRIISLIARLAIMAMILVPAVPAAATHGTPDIGSASVTVFQGKATLSDAGAGFYFPISPGEPQCNTLLGALPGLCPGGRGTWQLTIGASGDQGLGVNVTAQYWPTPTVTATVFGLSESTVSGVVGWGTAGLGAWCGYSRGDNGTGIVNTAVIDGLQVNTSGLVNPVVQLPAAALREVTWLQSAGTLIQSNGYAAAGGLNGTIHSLNSAVPIPDDSAPPKSCRNGTQTVFQVVGVSVTLLTN